MITLIVIMWILGISTSILGFMALIKEKFEIFHITAIVSIIAIVYGCAVLEFIDDDISNIYGFPLIMSMVIGIKVILFEVMWLCSILKECLITKKNRKIVV